MYVKPTVPANVATVASVAKTTAAPPVATVAVNRRYKVIIVKNKMGKILEKRRVKNPPNISFIFHCFNNELSIGTGAD